ncbi:MAG: late competence development ComFB family protein [Bacteroidota bacterium]
MPDNLRDEEIRLKNYMEDVVVDVYNGFAGQHPEICRCRQCRLDTIALALTRLRGLYAATAEGEILTRVNCEDRQIRADALVAVIEASRTVGERPKH